MTYHWDILGRPPARKSELPEEPEHESTGDWKGEQFIRASNLRAIPGAAPSGETKHVVQRRRKVLSLFKAGKSPSHMARKLKVTERTIYNDARVMGLRFLPGRTQR